MTQNSTSVVLGEWRSELRQQKEHHLTEFRQSKASRQSVQKLLSGLCSTHDHILTKLWDLHGLGEQATLLAVGGFGRGELFPYSDVDVLILIPDTPVSPTLSECLSQFVTACWDCNIEVGSSVRTLDECLTEAEKNITVQTAMLESRIICGAPSLYEAFSAQVQKHIDTKAFLRAKTLEMRQRHIKYENTPYSLEPNCKESPGGLRDLQILIWIAHAAGYGRSWAELAATGLITEFEARQLQLNENTLKLIRIWLHMIAKRREDRLVFDYQTTLAQELNLRPALGQRPSEALMKRYYWSAKAVVQLNRIVLLELEQRISGSGHMNIRPLGSDFVDRDGLLDIAQDDLYTRRPEAILETFCLFQEQSGISDFSPRTYRALFNARQLMDARFRQNPEVKKLFLRILQNPKGGQTRTLRLMNQTSVLGRTLWVFRRIVGQMQHDLFHVYTVDQHILMVLRNIRRFFLPEHAHEYTYCSQLASQFERPWVLTIAALFHDIAKGRGGDHSQLGSQEARHFCTSFQIEGADAELIDFLVREHLCMSRIAQKEDLSDPDTINQFAAIVKDERTLTALYLLTVADIRGTSPKVWNAWKGKLLEDLYRLTLKALGGSKLSRDTYTEAAKAEAIALLSLQAQLPQTEQALWNTLDVSYFSRHDPGELAWHARQLWRYIHTITPIVEARPSPLGEGLQVLVYVKDQTDLFMRLCAYFDGAGFNIQDAKIHTTHHGYALDTFQVIHNHENLADSSHHRDWIALVQSQLKTLLSSGELPLPPHKGRQSRRVKHFPLTPRVTLQPDERQQRWLLTVSASDRSGLLYSVARILAQHHINLQLAKITTLGERVEDTFVINGPELEITRKQVEIETDLLNALAA